MLLFVEAGPSVDDPRVVLRQIAIAIINLDTGLDVLLPDGTANPAPTKICTYETPAAHYTIIPTSLEVLLDKRLPIANKEDIKVLQTVLYGEIIIARNSLPDARRVRMRMGVEDNAPHIIAMSIKMPMYTGLSTVCTHFRKIAISTIDTTIGLVNRRPTTTAVVVMPHTPATVVPGRVYCEGVDPGLLSTTRMVRVRRDARLVLSASARHHPFGQAAKRAGGGLSFDATARVVDATTLPNSSGLEFGKWWVAHDRAEYRVRLDRAFVDIIPRLAAELSVRGEDIGDIVTFLFAIDARYAAWKAARTNKPATPAPEFEGFEKGAYRLGSFIYVGSHAELPCEPKPGDIIVYTQ